ncbi:MAG: hypothetical protein ACTSQF_00170 [Candidatus Heimdallarchaeaceae archaeon]
MAIIGYIDGLNRRIYLDVSTINTEIDPMDIYKEMRTLRRTDESLRNFDLFLSASGYESKGGGKFTAKLVKCLLGTRIVPYDYATYHEITITGEIITDDGQSGIACFDRTPLTPGNTVDINYVPPQVEVIEVDVPTATEPLTEEQIRSAVWNAETSKYNVFGTFGKKIATIARYIAVRKVK